MWKRIKIMYDRTTGQEYLPRYSRLSGDLDSYHPQLERRICDKNFQSAEWAKQARGLLEKSRHLLEQYKIDEAWKAFHTAKRLEIWGMNDEERLSMAKSLVEEMSKMNEWRREAILSLLGKNKNAITAAPSPEVLINAAELKDEHYNNQYYKNKLARNLFRLLFSILFLVIVGIIAFFLVNSRESGIRFDDSITMTTYLTGVLLFGFLGAVTSCILFTRSLSVSSRLTEISSSQVITISKIFIGAAFSVFIFLVLKSSIVENIKIFSFSMKSPPDYFVVAFLSGFSEKLAQKAILALIGKDKAEEAKGAVTKEN